MVERKIPFSYYGALVAMFFISNTLNNYALNFNISNYEISAGI